MKIPEQTLINELNKLRRKKSLQRSSEIASEQEIQEPTEYAADNKLTRLKKNTEI